MKRLIFVVFWAACMPVGAQPMLDPQGVYHASAPVRVSTPAGDATVGSPGALLAHGWTFAGPERIAQEEAAQSAAQAEAEEQAGLPMQVANGIAVLDENGHWVELLPTGDGLPVIGAQISNSPLEAGQRATMKAERKAASDARKAKAKDAKEKDKVPLLMEAQFGIKE